MPDSPSRFSLRTFTGSPGSYPSAQTGGVDEAASVREVQASPGGSVPDLDSLHPTAETWRQPSPGSGSGGGERPSLPSVPALRTVSPEPATGGIGIPLQAQVQVTLAAPRPSVPTTELVALPPAVAGDEREAPSTPAMDEIPSGARPVFRAPSAPGARNQRQRWQRWDVAVGTAVLLLVAYLLLAGVLYASRLWEARQTNSVTLLQDLGHGGESQITVTFERNHLMVTEIDNDDPTRVTILTVTEAIVLSTDKTVLEAWFQAVLQPSRLDLVIQLDGGLDWPPYHPQFTTILINNSAAIKQDPHAPGLRAPTAAELQQALHKLGP